MINWIILYHLNVFRQDNFIVILVSYLILMSWKGYYVQNDVQSEMIL